MPLFGKGTARHRNPAERRPTRDSKRDGRNAPRGRYVQGAITHGTETLRDLDAVPEPEEAPPAAAAHRKETGATVAEETGRAGVDGPSTPSALPPSRRGAPRTAADAQLEVFGSWAEWSEVKRLLFTLSSDGPSDGAGGCSADSLEKAKGLVDVWRCRVVPRRFLGAHRRAPATAEVPPYVDATLWLLQARNADAVAHAPKSEVGAVSGNDQGDGDDGDVARRTKEAASSLCGRKRPRSDAATRGVSSSIVVPSSAVQERLSVGYSFAISRAVHHLVHHSGAVAQTMQTGSDMSYRALAAVIGLPEEVVEVRNEIAHSRVPALTELRWTTALALDFLFQEYWSLQEQHVPLLSSGSTSTAAATPSSHAPLPSLQEMRALLGTLPPSAAAESSGAAAVAVARGREAPLSLSDLRERLRAFGSTERRSSATEPTARRFVQIA